MDLTLGNHQSSQIEADKQSKSRIKAETSQRTLSLRTLLFSNRTPKNSDKTTGRSGNKVFIKTTNCSDCNVDAKSDNTLSRLLGKLQMSRMDTVTLTRASLDTVVIPTNDSNFLNLKNTTFSDCKVEARGEPKSSVLQSQLKRARSLGEAVRSQQLCKDAEIPTRASTDEVVTRTKDRDLNTTNCSDCKVETKRENKSSIVQSRLSRTRSLGKQFFSLRSCTNSETPMGATVDKAVTLPKDINSVDMKTTNFSDCEGRAKGENNSFVEQSRLKSARLLGKPFRSQRSYKATETPIIQSVEKVGTLTKDRKLVVTITTECSDLDRKAEEENKSSVVQSRMRRTRSLGKSFRSQQLRKNSETSTICSVDEVVTPTTDRSYMDKKKATSSDSNAEVKRQFMPSIVQSRLRRVRSLGKRPHAQRSHMDTEKSTIHSVDFFTTFTKNEKVVDQQTTSVSNRDVQGKKETIPSLVRNLFRLQMSPVENTSPGYVEDRVTLLKDRNLWNPQLSSSSNCQLEDKQGTISSIKQTRLRKTPSLRNIFRSHRPSEDIKEHSVDSLMTLSKGGDVEEPQSILSSDCHFELKRENLFDSAATQWRKTPSLRNIISVPNALRKSENQTLPIGNDVPSPTKEGNIMEAKTPSRSDLKVEARRGKMLSTTTIKPRKGVSFRHLGFSHRLFEDSKKTLICSADDVTTHLKDGNIAAYFERSEVETGELLGTGSFAEAYEVTALHLSHNSCSSISVSQIARRYYSSKVLSEDGGSARYVVKVIKDSKKNDERAYNQAVKTLAIESTLLLQVDHPNIVSVRGLSVDKDLPLFIMMDRLSETLDSRIKTWKNSATLEGPDIKLIPTKARYALGIADALDHLHKKGIIYRDLKPGNLGFRDMDTIQLFDFGLARKLPSTTKLNENVFYMTMAGTRRYMAPEVFLGCLYNLKADVYSWAILSYEMLSELRPYPGYSVTEHQHSVCQQGVRPFVSPTSIPSAFEELLERAWDHDVSNRLRIDEVCKAIRGLINTPVLLELKKDSDELDALSTTIRLESSAA